MSNFSLNNIEILFALAFKFSYVCHCKKMTIFSIFFSSPTSWTSSLRSVARMFSTFNNKQEGLYCCMDDDTDLKSQKLANPLNLEAQFRI